jgi:hypothetical protein
MALYGMIGKSHEGAIGNNLKRVMLEKGQHKKVAQRQRDVPPLPQWFIFLGVSRCGS